MQLLSLDPAGYPLAISLNVLHLLTRLPVFVNALPKWMQFGSGRSRYLAAAKDLADADRRLEALRREAKGATLNWGWLVSDTYRGVRIQQLTIRAIRPQACRYCSF